MSMDILSNALLVDVGDVICSLLNASLEVLTSVIKTNNYYNYSYHSHHIHAS